MIKILAGEYRGKQLLFPPREITRPTTARAKAVLFDTLSGNKAFGDFIPPEVVVDVGAGSGAIGLEAMSRFSEAEGVFIDGAPDAISCLKQNVSACNAWGRARVIKHKLGSAGSAVTPNPSLVKRSAGHGVIGQSIAGLDRFVSGRTTWFFFDPPYDQAVVAWIVQFEQKIKLAKNPLIIVQEQGAPRQARRKHKKNLTSEAKDHIEINADFSLRQIHEKILPVAHFRFFAFLPEAAPA